jgi:hypothetical protein
MHRRLAGAGCAVNAQVPGRRRLRAAQARAFPVAGVSICGAARRAAGRRGAAPVPAGEAAVIIRRADQTRNRARAVWAGSGGHRPEISLPPGWVCCADAASDQAGTRRAATHAELDWAAPGAGRGNRRSFAVLADLSDVPLYRGGHRSRKRFGYPSDRQGIHTGARSVGPRRWFVKAGRPVKAEPKVWTLNRCVYASDV